MLRRSGILAVTLMAFASLSLAACGDDDTGTDNCGNGLIDSAEDCDGTNLDGRSCTSLGLSAGTLLCSADCSYNLSGCGGAGNCGNGAIDAGEQCDGADLASQTCATQGFVDGTLACSTSCAFDLSGCNAGVDCGNNTVDAGEQCDGADLGTGSCQSQGYDGGILACLTNCAYDTSGCTSGLCGNSNIDAGEDCDGGNLNSETCATQGFVDGTLACATSCNFDVSGCNAGVDCGNGSIDTGEDCDGGNLNNQDCTDLGYVGGTLSCMSNCAYNEGLCVYEICGNAAVEATEACDGANLNSQTCSSQSFDGGTLACAGDCHSFVTSGCCNDGCTSVGDTTCNSDVLRTCATQASGCLDYNDFDCTSGGQVCSTSGGTAHCEGACTSNCTNASDTQCSGSTLQTCTQNGSCLNWVDSNCHPGVCTGSTAACGANGTGHGCGDFYSIDGLSFPHTISDTFDDGAFTDKGSCQAAGENPLFLKYTVTGQIDQLTLTVNGGNANTWPIISAWTSTSPNGFCDPSARTELGCNHEQSANGVLLLTSPSVSAGDVIYFLVSGDWSNGTLINPTIDLEVVDCTSSSTTSLLALPTQLNDVAVDTNITVQFTGELPATNNGMVQVLENGVPTNYTLASSPPEITFFGNEMTINPGTDFATDVDITVQLNLLSEVCGATINDAFTFHTVAGPPPNGEDCARAVAINNTGVTNILGTFTAVTLDELNATRVSCYSGFSSSKDVVFSFEMQAPMTEVSIMIDKSSTWTYAAVLLDSCGAATSTACTVLDNNGLMVLDAHGLTAGTYYLVIGNIGNDTFPDNSFDQINITQYRSGNASTPASGVGTVDYGLGGGPQGLGTAGNTLPMFVDYGSDEDVTPGDVGYRVFHVASAAGIRVVGTYDTNDGLWHRFRIKDAAGIYYYDRMGTGSFDVYVPGDTAILGTVSYSSNTIGYDYTVTDVFYD